MTRRPRSVLAVMTLAVVALGACGDDGADPAESDTVPEASDLDGTSWGDASVEGYELAGTLEFAFEEGRVAVTGGCNTMSGPYELSDGLMTAGPLMATLMACDSDLMDQDAWIGGLLETGLDASLAGDELTLTSEDAVITLTSTT